MRAGAVSDGFTATQRSAPNRQCSRLMAVGVSAKQVFPPRVVAGQTAAVVPAAGVLAHVAPDGGLVADLGRGDPASRLRQHPVPLPNIGVGGHLRQGGHGPDFNPTVFGGANVPQLFNAAQVDDGLHPLDPVFQPVKGVQAAPEGPAVFAVAPGSATASAMVVG